MARDRDDRRVTPIATIGLVLAVLSAVAGAGAGLGYRFGWWSLDAGSDCCATRFMARSQPW
jgi:hypothetical protein